MHGAHPESLTIHATHTVNKTTSPVHVHPAPDSRVQQPATTSAAPVEDTPPPFVGAQPPIHTMRNGQVPCLACKGAKPYLTYPASHASCRCRCRCRSAGQQPGSASLRAPEAAWLVVHWFPSQRGVLPVSWPHRFLTGRQRVTPTNQPQSKWQSDVQSPDSLAGKAHTHAAHRCRSGLASEF